MIRSTLAALGGAGLRRGLKVLAGGAAVTEAFVASAGIDGYAPDASAAVRTAKRVLGVG